MSNGNYHYSRPPLCRCNEKKQARLHVFVVQVEFFCPFLSTTRGNSTCHVPSLLHAGSRSSSSWRLQGTQTSTDSSINWFTEQTTFFFPPSSCSIGQGHKFMQSCRETPHAGCGCGRGPGPTHPEAKWENAAWHAIESTAKSPPQTWLLAPQFISISVNPPNSPVLLLPVSGPVSCQELISDLCELVSSLEMFTDELLHQSQLQIKLGLSSQIANWENKHLEPWNIFFPESYYITALLSSCSSPPSASPPTPPS